MSFGPESKSTFGESLDRCAEPSIYLVGGAVRDILLGREPEDKDFVVVGSTPEQMLAKGFQQVGANFPVFLHPMTGDEYALARTERKVGKGYSGFETFFDASVTLEEDLRRRDLTINAMAMPTREVPGIGLVVDKSELIDPYGGQEDLRSNVLRHTSEAFAEDPLRVLRLARFAARYDATVATATYTLARQLVQAGELEFLTHERVWKEVTRAVMEPKLTRFFEVLFEANVMETNFFANVFAGLTLARVRDVAPVMKALNTPLEVRIAVLSSLDTFELEDFKQEGVTHWLAQQRTFLNHELYVSYTRATTLLNVLDHARLFQPSPKAGLFFQLVNLLCLTGDIPANSFKLLLEALEAAKTVDGAAVTAGLIGRARGQAVYDARVRAIESSWL